MIFQHSDQRCDLREEEVLLLLNFSTFEPMSGVMTVITLQQNGIRSAYKIHGQQRNYNIIGVVSMAIMLQ